MENSKLIGGNSFIYDGYDVTVMPHSQKKIDLYIRDNLRMEIYEAKGFELQKINTKALQDALRKSRKDITCSFVENDCDGVSLLELVVYIQMPLIPKITESIFLKKTKTLENSEIINARLLDIKKTIMKNRESLAEINNFFGNKIVKSYPDIFYSSQAKEVVASLTVEKAGRYLITLSAFLSGNASTYVHIEFTKGNINPGTYVGLQTDTQKNPMCWYMRCVVEVAENATLELSGTSGTSYSWNMKNLIISAERLDEGK